MKVHLLYASCFMSAVAFTACDNEINEPLAMDEYLTIEASMSIESRTVLNADDETVVWSTGDELYLFGGNTSVTMTLKDGAGDNVGTFIGKPNGSTSQLKTALYPVPTEKDGKYTFELPAERSYSENSAAPMIGILNGSRVTFENLTALVRVYLPACESDQKLELVMEGIAGTLLVDEEKKTVETQDSQDKVTVTIPAGEARTVDIPVPAKTYNDGYKVILDDVTIIESTEQKILNEENVAILVQKVANLAELTDAMERGGTVYLGTDYVKGSGENNYLEMSGDGKNSTLNGNGMTLELGTTSDYAIIARGNSVRTFNDVNIISGGGGVGATSGAQVVFNGQKVEVNSASTSGRYNFYASGEGTTITINDGKFSFSKTLNQKRAYIYADKGTTVYVNGGTFGPASTRDGYTAGILGNGTIIITGGTFGFDPSQWVADGYQAVKNENNQWVVSSTNP